VDAYPAAAFRDHGRVVIDRFFAQYYATHPVNATFTGAHSVDDRLPNWSSAGLAHELYEIRALLDTMPSLDAFEISKMRAQPAMLDLRLARANLTVRAMEHETGFFVRRNPALWTGEAIFGAVSLMIRDYAPVAERTRALISRLRAVPAFLAQMPHVLERAIPAPWTARAARECEAAQGLFDSGLQQWIALNALDSTTSATLLAAAASAREAFSATEAWLHALPAAPASAMAIGKLPYTTLLRAGHFCDQTVDELLADALRDLASERETLTAMATEECGSLEHALTAIANDHPSTEEYLGTFERRWEECHRIAEQADAVTWPSWPIRYVPIPKWAREWSSQLYWLFYRSPAPFDPYTVYDYVVTPIDDSLSESDQAQRLRANNHSTITLNHAVHHGAIGHHVQNWHARHRATSRIGRVAAVDCASRIGMFLGGSLAEGWACYATTLMEELGMLTPLERISEQHTRVRMLARAIVDIRLHTGRITFAEACQFYVDTVGMSAAVANAEVTKNSMFPCTAIMYWLGTRGILQLRERMRAALGPTFSLRTFHDTLLGYGAIPVCLIADLMMEPVA
jgi:uncharacterized protein (DUF885 family)